MPKPFHRPRILHLDNSIAFTGAFHALLSMCKALEGEFENAVILPTNSRCIEHLKEAGIRHYQLDFREINRQFLTPFLYFPFLVANAVRTRKIISRENNVVLLHGNDLFNLTFIATKVLFPGTPPLLTHVRFMPASFPPAIYHCWQRLQLRYADSLVAVSNAVQASWGNPAKMSVMYDIGDLEERHPPYVFQRSPHEPFRFLYLANYIPGKGQDLALQAFIDLQGGSIPATLTFAGSDMGLDSNRSFKNRLMEMVASHALSDKILFEDFASDVEGKMKQFHAVLNFSHAESFSMICWDSLRFGVPLIASDCGGPSELFENGSSGLLVPNKDYQAMAAAMRRLANDPELCRTLSQNSRTHIGRIVSERRGATYSGLVDTILRRNG